MGKLPQAFLGCPGTLGRGPEPPRPSSPSLTAWGDCCLPRGCWGLTLRAEPLCKGSPQPDRDHGEIHGLLGAPGRGGVKGGPFDL